MKKLMSIILLSALPFAAVSAAPDIDVRKSVNNEFPIADEPVEFTVQVNNIGDELAAAVVIVDLLPTEMTIPAGAAAFPSVGTYDPASGEWLIGDMDAGAAAVLVVPAVVTEQQPPACIVNLASSQFADVPTDTNDDARAAIHQAGIERCVDLGVDFGISASPLSIFPNCDSQERYEGNARVTNYGPDAARDVIVMIAQSPVVGPNLRFNDTDCDNAPSAHCQISELAAGETITIDVTSDLYQSYSTFTQTLSVRVSSSDVDYDVSNDEPSSSGSAGGFSSCQEIDLGLSDVAFGPGCFIATAAYGTPLDSRLDILRGFRDRFMITNAPGRALIRFYYRHSPPMADFIAERDWLRTIVRGLLTPIVFAIEYPAWAVLILILLASAAGIRRLRLPRYITTDAVDVVFRDADKRYLR